MSTKKLLNKSFRMKNEELRAARKMHHNMRVYVLSLPQFKGKRGYIGRPFRLARPSLLAGEDRISGPDMPLEFLREGRAQVRPGAARRRGDIVLVPDKLDVYPVIHKPSRSIYG